MPGRPLQDLWDDIGPLNSQAKERLGYPTQKPEALLERLVTACTEPGDLVVDPYVGSGTTLAVCARTGRRAIGIDIGRRALLLTKRRLRALGVEASEERVIPLESDSDPSSVEVRAS
jgi:site-specific DNA-methyltransferase (adenine-specific)